MKKREKIPYDDAIADQVITTHGLRPEVKKVWRTRGHIPGDYLDENRDITRKLTDNDPEYRKFIEILSRPEIAATKFRTLGQKGADIRREKDRMSEAERVGFRTEITEIRNKLRLAKDIPTTRNMLAALKDVRLHPTNIIERNLYSKLLRDGEMTAWEKNEAVINILALYNAIRI